VTQVSSDCGEAIPEDNKVIEMEQNDQRQEEENSNDNTLNLQSE